MARSSSKARRKQRQLSVGRLRLTRRGYGFVSTAEGEYFILPSRLGGAMDGDTVEVARVRPAEGRQRVSDDDAGQGRVSRILERRHHTIIGELSERDGLRAVRPLDERIPYDIFIDPREASQPAADGDIVEVRLTTWPSRNTAASGYIASVVGQAGQPGIGIEVILRSHGIAEGFPPEALAEARALEAGGEAASGMAAELVEEGVLDGGQANLVARVIEAAGESADGMAAELVETGVHDAGLTNTVRHASEGQTLATSQPGYGRRDLRQVLCFTIDPSDARDFDDAISLEYVNGDLLLGVHIADVSAFVEAGGAIDAAARERATSVYLPDRVVPMLPEQLTFGLCSLQPGQDRLALSALIRLDRDANVLSCEFTPSLIRSSARLSYEQVDAYLEQAGGRKAADATGELGDEIPDVRDASLELGGCLQEQVAGSELGCCLCGQPAGQAADDASTRSSDASPAETLISPELGRRLRDADRLARRLRRRRIARGAIDFDSAEVKVSLDSQGRPDAVSLRQRTAATSLIEEAMILANEQVAAFFLAKEAPTAYRVHEDPLPQVLSQAAQKLKALGLISGRSEPSSSAEVQAILEAAAGRPEFSLVSYTLLRAMKRARYHSQYTGHYGLASPGYCHFTAPIRRYPDLVVHRLLKARLAREKPPAGLLEGLEALCEHCSEREWAADSASREATQLMVVEYLADQVGQAFSAMVVSASRLGLFVSLDQTGVEGLIPRDSLPPGYHLDPDGLGYSDSSGRLALQLGSQVEVRLTAANLSRAELDFELA